MNNSFNLSEWALRHKSLVWYLMIIASVAGILKAGDWFSVNGELKQLVVDLDSDSAGRGVATFEPPLRAQAPVNAPLLLVKPTSTYILTSEPPRWGQQGAKVTQQTMTFEEDFRP